MFSYNRRVTEEELQSADAKFSKDKLRSVIGRDAYKYNEKEQLYVEYGWIANKADIDKWLESGKDIEFWTV